MTKAGRWLNPTDSRPRRELYGLSPAQAAALLATDWSTGVLTLRHDLPLEALSESSLLRDVRALLCAITERGTVAMTPAGWLDPPFVDYMMDHLSTLAEFADEIRREDPPTLMTEEHTAPIQHVRRAAQELGLLDLRPGEVRLSERGQDWLRPESADVLYSHLFQWMLSREGVKHTFIHQALQVVTDGAFNVHQLSAFALWGLGRLPNDWWPTSAMGFALAPPWVIDQWLDRAGEEYLATVVVLSVFPALRELGLIEEREYPDAENIPEGGETSDARRTSLYKAVLQWNFKPEPPDLGLRGGQGFVH